MSEQVASAEIRPIRVVLAEDSPTEAACLEFLLSKNGYAVVVAQDGEEALRAVRAEPPDVVVSDIVMPVMDGCELCRAMKGDPATAGVPVMLVTGLSDPADVLRGLAAGADDFLLKPYDERMLLSRIGLLISLPRGGPAPTLTGDILVDFQGREYVISARAQSMVQALLVAYEEPDRRHAQIAEVARCVRRAGEAL